MQCLQESCSSKYIYGQLKTVKWTAWGVAKDPEPLSVCTDGQMNWLELLKGYSCMENVFGGGYSLGVQTGTMQM